jgi:uncharacterized protein (DUF1015 family)
MKAEPMARVIPFVGTRFNPLAVKDLAAVTSPPYDVIDHRLQEALYERSPVNIVRLILGKELVDDDEYNNKYQRAASCLKDWKNNGTLMDDSGKHFYVYQQQFEGPDKEVHTRTGFFAAILIETPGEKSRIHAHERTFEGPKADRLKLLRSTQANLCSIFCLYSDPQAETDRILAEAMSKEPPRMELVDDDKVTHRLWLMSDRNQIKKLSGLMQEKDFFIADGHHRYETAVRYFQEMRKSHEPGRDPKVPPPSAYVMAFLTNCDAPGLLILPTHRVLSRELGEGVDIKEVLEDLKEYFDVTPVKVDLKKTPTEGPRLLEQLVELGKKGTAFAMVLPGGKGYYLSLKSKEAIRHEMSEDTHPDIAALDASVLHEYIIPQVWVGNAEMEFDDHDIFYVKDAGDALKMLCAPTFASAVFLMNAPSVGQVRTIAMQNLRMPHKSTYFYPKLLTGMVVRDHTVA